jgi:predicted membrane protein
VVFSGKDKHIESKNFSGGKATSIFGGMKLDLRDIGLAKDGATIDAASVFGSLKIYVPRNIKVETSGTPILGSWENTFRSESKAKTKVLKITGVAIFGSVEIIN